MKRYLEERINPSRVRYYKVSAMLLLFVGSGIVGMLLVSMYSAGEPLLPFMATDRLETQPSPSTLSGSYLASRFARANEDFDAAAHYAKEAMRFEDVDPQLKTQSLRLMLAAGELDEAEKLAQAFAKDKEIDPLAALLHFGVMMREARYEEAGALLKEDANEGMFQLILPALRSWVDVGLMQQGKKAKEPIKDFKGVDMQGFLAPFMQYQRGLMNDLLGEKQEARAAYEATMYAPSLVPYRLVQAVANFYLREGERDKAAALYEEYKTHHPDSIFGLPDLDAPENAQQLVSSPAEGAAEIYFTAASLLFSERARQETLIYLRLALALRPNFPAAQMLLASIYELQEQHEKAVELYRSIDANSVFFKQGRLRVALNYRAAGHTDAAIRLLDQMIMDKPDDEAALSLMGDILRFEKDYKRSAMVFEEAIKRNPNAHWSWEFYYKYAMALERSKRWEDAEKYFNKALEISPEEADVLNYLGYSMLEKGKDLAKATDLIAKAYALDPNAAHIIDSMGWAYYLQGDFEKAVEFLEQAIDLAPQDPTLNDHLGDAYWRVGRRLEAKYQWERALIFEPEDPEPIRKKIESGLPPLPKENSEGKAEGDDAS